MQQIKIIFDVYLVNILHEYQAKQRLIAVTSHLNGVRKSSIIDEMHKTLLCERGVKKSIIMDEMQKTLCE